MQIFQKKDAWLGGMDEAIAILKLCANDFEELEVRALYDGDRIEPYEPVMHDRRATTPPSRSSRRPCSEPSRGGR